MKYIFKIFTAIILMIAIGADAQVVNIPRAVQLDSTVFATQYGQDTLAENVYEYIDANSSTDITTGDKGEIDVVNASNDWRIDTGAVSWIKLAQAVKDSINAGGGGTSRTIYTLPSNTFSDPKNPTLAELSEYATDSINATAGDVLKYCPDKMLFGASRLIEGNDDTYNAFPGFVIAPNGDYIIVWYDGPAHVGPGGVIKQRISKDKGRTWLTATTIMDGVGDDRDPEINVIRDTLVLTFFDIQGDTSKIWIARSVNNGVTWTSRIAITTPAGWSSAYMTAKAVLADDGAWLISPYGKATTAATTFSVKIGRSVNGGTSWTWATIPGGLNTNETTLHTLGGGKVLALIRADGSTRLYRSFSYNNGANWTTPEATSITDQISDGTRPTANVFPDGRILLIYRDTMESRGYMNYTISTDLGDTWSALTRVNTTNEPFNYASIFPISANQLGVAYAIELPSGKCNTYWSTITIPDCWEWQYQTDTTFLPLQTGGTIQNDFWVTVQGDSIEFYDRATKTALHKDVFGFFTDDGTSINTKSNRKIKITTATPSGVGAIDVTHQVNSATDPFFIFRDGSGQGEVGFYDNSSTSTHTLPTLRGTSFGVDGFGLTLSGLMPDARDVLSASGAGIILQSRRSTASPLFGANLFMLRNYTTNELTVDVAGKWAFGSHAPAAKIDIISEGTSTGSALLIKNSTPTSIFDLKDNGQILFGNPLTTTSKYEFYQPNGAANTVYHRVAAGSLGGYVSIQEGMSSTGTFLPILRGSSQTSTGADGFGFVIEGQPSADVSVSTSAALVFSARNSAGTAVVNTNAFMWKNAATVLGNMPAGGGLNIGTGSFTAAMGVINAGVGLRINNAATSGQYLRGNGTNFVSSAIQAADIPNLGGDLSGNIASAQIVSGAVGTTELADGGVAWVDLDPAVKDSINAGGEMPTYDTYDAMRDSANTTTDIVFVKDFVSQAGWTVRGGFFKLATGTASDENGGTKIYITGTTVRERVWDNVVAYPTWFEVDSVAYITGVTQTLRETCFDGGMAIQKAANVGEVIELDNDRTYLFSRTAQLVAKQTLRGDNATLKRKDAIVTTSTGATSIGGTTIDVASTAGFYPGMGISVATDSLHDNHAGYASTVVSIAGNTITVAPAWTKVVASGNVVFSHTGALIGGAPNVVIENCRFDGNRYNNDYTYDWRFGASLSMGSSSSGTITSQCHFSNSPCENIFISQNNHIISQCSFTSLAGSFVHITTASENANQSIQIINCIGDSSNLITNTMSGHSEAVITYSDYSVNLKLKDSDFRNPGAGAYIFSPMGTDDYSFWVEGNYFSNFSGIVTASEANGDRKDFVIRNNTFVLCGDIYLRGNDLTTNKRLDRIAIEGNTFTRTRMAFYNVTNLSISNNTIIMPLGTTASGYYTSALNASAPGIIGFGGGAYDNVRVVNNTIVGDTLVSTYVQGGIYFAVNTARGTGFNAKLYYPQGINVSFNQIDQLRYGIAVVDYNTSVLTKQCVNWEFSHNQVTLTRDSSYLLSNAGYGIIAYPGVVAKNNTCRSQLRMNNSIPMVLYGIDESAGVDTSALHGAIAKNNVLIGTNRTLMISTNSSNTLNQYNCVAENNILIGADVINYSNYNSHGHRSYAGDNTVLNSTLLPAFTSQKLFKIQHPDE